ncbi:MAG TPA: CDP-alcohol phosphatidyltransferase family protein [Chryseosolibacter sp.]
MDQKVRSEFKDLGALLLRSGRAARIINLITLYRIITFPLLIALALTGKTVLFKWMLLASFLTDAIDGFLARKYKAFSILGAKLDSIGDDLTILAATAALMLQHWDFIKEQAAVFIILFCLFILQLVAALLRYGKMSTFHTYLAKTAAVITALFLLSVFFLGSISYTLFYTAALVTGIELLEEIVLVLKLPDYRTNVKGLYWVWRGSKR